jgi:hypothetical protein
VKPKCSSPVLLSWARTLLQSASSSQPPRCHRALSNPVGHRSSSHEVSRPFSVSPLTAAASCERPGLPDPTDLRPQVFSTSRRVSIRCEPAGLVSCRIRSWGWTLQSFAPTAWPYAVSGADPLMTLVPARYHLVTPAPPDLTRRRCRTAEPSASSRPPKRPSRPGPSVPAEQKALSKPDVPSVPLRPKPRWSE